MFVFKGISSDDMEVIAEEENFVAKARQRYNQIEIDGRNGALFEELGYSTVDRPIKIAILNNNKIDYILKWLDGEGDFIYKNRRTKARFYNEIEPNRTSSIFVAEVSFNRDPFWYKLKDSFITINTDIIINEGTIYSEPVLRLEKKNSNYVDFSINEERYKYTFNEDSYVEIDSSEGVTVYEGFNRSRQLEMGYIFPTLKSGKNKLIINSGDAIFKFKRKDRWL